VLDTPPKPLCCYRLAYIYAIVTRHKQCQTHESDNDDAIRNSQGNRAQGNNAINGFAPDPLTKADKLGFSAQGHFSRSQFGLGTWYPAVGDEVRVRIEAEFVKAQVSELKAAKTTHLGKGEG
jgi:hypothetical protein